MRKYIREQFQHYHDIRNSAVVKYAEEKSETFKDVHNNDWHRADAIMFILEKVCIEYDEICKEFTGGKK